MLNKSQMIDEILIQCKANNVPTTGDLFFGLAFRTESELKKMCTELNININQGVNHV